MMTNPSFDSSPVIPAHSGDPKTAPSEVSPAGKLDPSEEEIGVSEVSPADELDLSKEEIGVGAGDDYLAMLAQERRLQGGEDGQQVRGEPYPSRRLEVLKGPPYRYTNE